MQDEQDMSALYGPVRRVEHVLIGLKCAYGHPLVLVDGYEELIFKLPRFRDTELITEADQGSSLSDLAYVHRQTAGAHNRWADP